MSAHPAIKTIVKGICFYSSQIRHHTELNPAFEIELIFPHYEQPHSSNFNQRAYDETLTVLSNKLI
ncbi:hypothetical protein [Pseudoalteromonas sp. APC 3694]|uniref:hypothetical protein n=1 Tax=Pseudoalteromonas sp. APC 3694 TaxID=3035202 RepID=UPI0025B549BF|nr:hypothetical protein [Pseudoalteromonas sp. APC 3694]MDN3490116.1 hypothetical protein [Pseudoalteromonas sp. APC 3694]